MTKGKVYIVGAGCGDYDLITLRGAELLKRGEVIVYDSLIDSRLLNYAAEDAEKICVGKRAGRASETQEKINNVLVEKACGGKTVIRLKGGDPFVFGRGGEEVLALQEHDIQYTIVPGITSAVAVPELAGIPVTHRGIARSFHVITGHTKEDFIPENMGLYAKLEGTLVFLMGLNNLPKIVSSLVANGKSPDTPAAVVSNGVYATEQKVTGTLADICHIVSQYKIKAPAVIIVGKVCEFDFASSLQRPLDNISVTVTGTAKTVNKLYEELNEMGAKVHMLDFLEVQEYEDNPAFDEALENIDKYTHIALTSPNGADILMRRLGRLKIDIRTLAHIKFATIGSGTAKELEKYRIHSEIMPEDYTSEAFGTLLSETLSKDDRLLILRAEKGSPVLTKKLKEGNIDFTDIRTYDVQGRVHEGEKHISTDYITFASASGVSSFFESGLKIGSHTRIVCIGDVTLQALEQYGIVEVVSADVKDVAGITAAIINDVKERKDAEIQKIESE